MRVEARIVVRNGQESYSPEIYKCEKAIVFDFQGDESLTVRELGAVPTLTQHVADYVASEFNPREVFEDWNLKQAVERAESETRKQVKETDGNIFSAEQKVRNLEAQLKQRDCVLKEVAKLLNKADLMTMAATDPTVKKFIEEDSDDKE